MPLHLQRSAIDDRRWNEAVARDNTHLPYGFTWWLDAVSPGRWSGLVLDDYRAIMPLPLESFSLRRPISSWARPQVQRPFFTQQCGPFGDLRPGDLTQLFANLPNGLNSFSLPLTENADPSEIPAGYTPEFRTNYLLDLSPDLETIRAGYHKDLRRKLRKFGPGHLSEVAPSLILEQMQRHVAAKAQLNPAHFRAALRIMKAAIHLGYGYCYQLHDDDELLASNFLLGTNGRFVNLLPSSSPAGYRREGMARLLDAFIARHRGPGHLLDFEGSDVPGIAKFFSSFGPEKRPYLTVR